MIYIVQDLLLTTKLRFASITAKWWWPRFNETYISGSALEVESAVKRPRVSIVLGYAMLMSSN